MKTLPFNAGLQPGGSVPAIRRIALSDLADCLRRGWDDFLHRPSHYVFLAAIYPIAGVAIALAVTNASAFPVLFPLVAGFAILGPVAALGFYEISRRAERGEAVSWRHAFDVLDSPSRGAVLRVALALFAVFFLWLVSAWSLFALLAPDVAAPNYPAFLRALLASPSGWVLMVVGNLLGLVFAVVAFSIGALSLPLILDRHVSAGEAMAASVETVRANPAVMGAWGLVVAGLLALGSLPLLVGLAVVLPVLGHATWHLYRRVMG